METYTQYPTHLRSRNDALTLQIHPSVDVIFLWVCRPQFLQAFNDIWHIVVVSGQGFA
jgi:hypothetical protein